MKLPPLDYVSPMSVAEVVRLLAHALLSSEPEVDEERIREVLSGNLCHCTGYIPIVEAVLEAHEAYRRAESVQ